MRYRIMFWSDDPRDAAYGGAIGPAIRASSIDNVYQGLWSHCKTRKDLGFSITHWDNEGNIEFMSATGKIPADSEVFVVIDHDDSTEVL